MNRILCLSVVAVCLACSGNKERDQRTFGSLSASFSSKTSPDNPSSADGTIQAGDSVIISEGIDGGTIDDLGKKASLPVEAKPTGKESNPPTPETPAPTPTAKSPELPDGIKAKLAKCYPQWDKGGASKDLTYDIRQVTIDVEKLKSSSIQLTGSKPEVVFVDISSASRISKVSLSLENTKGLYCLDISADKSIEYLDVAYICGAKLGVIEIEGGKAKKVNIREFCPTP